jgi:hypothetical protein
MKCWGYVQIARALVLLGVVVAAGGCVEQGLVSTARADEIRSEDTRASDPKPMELQPYFGETFADAEMALARLDPAQQGEAPSF